MGTREAILEEALKLFSEKGIKETTVRDIARAVGITEGAIYRHFESKEQIVYELFEMYSEELYERIAKVFKEHEDREGRFKEVVRTFLDFSFRNPDAFRYLNIFHYLRGKEVKRFKKIPFALLKDIVLELENAPVALVDQKLVRQHHALPLFRRGNRLFVGVSDPTNFQALDEIKFNRRYF